MAHKIKFKLHNWKLIDDMSLELTEDSNLWLVKGPNESGKTSVLQAILSLITIKNFVPKPLKDGAEAGVIEGEIPGPGGIYSVKMDISPTNTSFQMYSPTGARISKVSEMRNVFKYNSMTTEDFIKKSYSTAGRREQIKILASLLDLDSKMEFERLLASVDTTKGGLYIDRKRAKSAYEELQSQLKANAVSDEDAKLYNESSKVDDYLKQLRDREAVLAKIPSKKDELEMLNFGYEEDRKDLKGKKTYLESDVEAITGEIEQLEQRIEELKQRKIEREGKIIKVNNDLISLEEVYTSNIAATNAREDTEEEFAQITKEINEIETSRSKVLRIGGRIDVYNELMKKEPPLRSTMNITETALTVAREKLLELIKEISIPGYNLTIEDDTIFIDGYPLNEHQVADSKLIIAVSAILAKVNKDSPLLVVGKLAELDKVSLKKLENVAKDNNCTIIGDYVSNDITDITVEGIVEEGTKDAKISMDNTGKPHKHPESLDEI